MLLSGGRGISDSCRIGLGPYRIVIGPPSVRAALQQILLLALLFIFLRLLPGLVKQYRHSGNSYGTSDSYSMGIQTIPRDSKRGVALTQTPQLGLVGASLGFYQTHMMVNLSPRVL